MQKKVSSSFEVNLIKSLIIFLASLKKCILNKVYFLSKNTECFFNSEQNYKFGLLQLLTITQYSTLKQAKLTFYFTATHLYL